MLELDRIKVAMLVPDEVSRLDQGVSHLLGLYDLDGEPVVILCLGLQILKLFQLALNQLLLLPRLILLVEDLLSGPSAFDARSQQ